MSERTSGLHRIVTVPALYELIQAALGSSDGKERVATLLFAGLAGKHVVEVGCGPGRWADQMRDVESYLGIDRNPHHIETARKRHASAEIRFLCADLSDRSVMDAARGCDAVIGIGILHHLDDPVASDMLADAAGVLAAGGRYIGLEPVYHDRQHPVARLLKWLDSGRNIRREEAYRALFPSCFEVATRIATDLMRVPYSHCIITGRKT